MPGPAAFSYCTSVSFLGLPWAGVLPLHPSCEREPLSRLDPCEVLERFTLMLDDESRDAEVAQFKRDYSISIAISKLDRPWAAEMDKRSLFQRTPHLSAVRRHTA